MESSIAVFLMRWVACELPPTVEDRGEGQSVLVDLFVFSAHCVFKCPVILDLHPFTFQWMCWEHAFSAFWL